MFRHEQALKCSLLAVILSPERRSSDLLLLDMPPMLSVRALYVSRGRAEAVLYGATKPKSVSLLD